MNMIAFLSFCLKKHFKIFEEKIPEMNPSSSCWNVQNTGQNTSSDNIFNNYLAAPEGNYDTFNNTSNPSIQLWSNPTIVLPAFYDFGLAKPTEPKENTAEEEVFSLDTVGDTQKNKYGIQEKILPDGRKVLACRWSKFEKCQPEWLELQQYMYQAAKELGLTLVYSDVERTVAQSNAGRARKGNLVVAGRKSPHNYGVAADILLFKDGKPVSVNSSLQKQFADKVKELSDDRIEWGGEWKKAGERHHFELRGWRNKYKYAQYLVG